jgi:hypothetical protein
MPNETFFEPLYLCIVHPKCRLRKMVEENSACDTIYELYGVMFLGFSTRVILVKALKLCAS